MPDAPDDFEVEDDGAAGGDSPQLADVRKWGRRMERERNAFEKQIGELTEFRQKVEAERREASISAAFEEAKLAPEHAELFKKVNADATEVKAEDVLAFAQQYKLPTVEGEQAPAPEPKNDSFAPKGGGNVPSGTKLTMEDVNNMLREGRHAEVQAAFTEGRVDREARIGQDRSA
jgi:vancomycin resistance protein YoaR